MRASLSHITSYVVPFFARPVRLLRGYDRPQLRADAVAGLTVAVILLPQAIAFALIAGLPPSVGLYTAVVGAVVGALWGSSAQIHNGPTSAVSLIVLSSASAAAPVGSSEFVVAAGLLAAMAGVVQLGMGLARLGVLVNFVSDSVIVGFAAGAGILIGVGELKHFLGVDVPGRGLLHTLGYLATHLAEIHPPTVALGAGSLGGILLLKRLRPTLPATLVCLVLAALALVAFGLDEAGVAVLGTLPSTPPLPQALPLSLDVFAQLSSGALAIAAIGLIQTMAVARSLAAQSGDRLDSNQEFVGQGLSNLACGFLSGYPSSGSFSRSAVNASAGARTPIAAVLSGGFVLVAMLFLGSLTAYLPRAALSGALLVVAFGMIDRDAIARIVRGTTVAETAIMGTTLFGTLLLPIEVAVLTGILMSLGAYILKTSAPQVQSVLPDARFRHFTTHADEASCPQLGILDVHGDLYFGATTHVEEAIRDHAAAHPTQRFLLLRMQGVNHCDFSGIRMLEGLVRSYRERGGDVFLTRVQRPILRFMIKTEFHRFLGRDHFLSADVAIEHLFHHVLDPAICIYESNVRAFRECQTLPRPDYPVALPVINDVPTGSVPTVAPLALWNALHPDRRTGAGPLRRSDDRGTGRADGGRVPTWTPNEATGLAQGPRVIDVREPREYRQGHVPGAELVPLPELLRDPPDATSTRAVVLVCRGGRRSTRAAFFLRDRGHDAVSVLDGGMLAWEAEGLLEASGQ